MANKTTLDSLTRPGLPTPHGAKDGGQAANEYKDDAEHDDLTERFRESIQRGNPGGDVVFLDEQGREIKGALSTKTIFDLQPAVY